MNILVLCSSFQTDAFVEKEYAELFGLLKKRCGAKIWILGDDEESIRKWLADGFEPHCLMTATGGVENLFTRIMLFLGRDVTIIADGRNNSLAAALEILAYLQGSGRNGLILHGTNDEICTRLMMSRNVLSGVRLARFGKPSDWLIASDVDSSCLREKYGVEVLDIDMQKLIDGIAEVSKSDAVAVARDAVGRSKDSIEPSCADVLEAAKVYLALKKICIDEDINALTIRCFDMLKSCNTTSCLALALLNDEGIVAGCEGDMQSLMSMLLAERLCGEKAFMANPSILTDTTSMFAHCTIPVSMCDDVTLRSHFESSIGVALQGSLREEAYTILKWGGTRLDRFFTAEAESVAIPYSDHFCRTQICLGINMKPYLLKHTIGNHHIIIKGRHASSIRVFMSENGVTEV